MKIDADAVRDILYKKLYKVKFFHVVMGNKKAFRRAEMFLNEVQDEVEELIMKEYVKQAKPECTFDINLFDEMEFYPNCSVQVLHNSETDEYSVGWWDNDKMNERKNEL